MEIYIFLQKMRDGLRVGLIYFDIGDHKSCAKHLEQYIEVSPNAGLEVEALLEVCHQKINVHNWKYWSDHVVKTEHMLAEMLSTRGYDLSKAKKLLLQLDKSLKIIADNVANLFGIDLGLVDHLNGQLALHCASMLFEIQSHTNHREIIKNILPILLKANQFGQSASPLLRTKRLSSGPIRWKVRFFICTFMRICFSILHRFNCNFLSVH